MPRVLVLDFNERTRVASCWLKEDWKFLKVQIQNGETVGPKPGQFLTLDTTRSAYLDGVIQAPNVQISNACAEDCLDFKTGRLRISAWIAFSDDPAHPVHTREFGFADWYGIVDCNGQGRKDHMVFGSFLVVNDLDFAENGTKLFKVDMMKHPITGDKKKPEVDALLDKMRSHFHNQLPSISSSVPSFDNRQVFIPSERRLSETRPLPVPSRLTPIYPDQRLPETRVTPSSGQRLSLVCNCAVLMLQEQNGYQIVWMCAEKQAARLRSGVLRVGSAIQCRYTPLRAEPGAQFEVTEVLSELQTLPFPLEELNSDCFVALLKVDVCSPNWNFRDWSWLTEQPVFNAASVGVCVAEDTIECPDGSTTTWQKAMRLYAGDKRAKEMLAYCRLVEQRVPRGLAEMVENTQGAELETVIRYVWKLMKLKGVSGIADRSERHILQQNLGRRLHEYQQEDELEREKRMARMNLGGYDRSYY